MIAAYFSQVFNFERFKFGFGTQWKCRECENQNFAILNFARAPKSKIVFLPKIQNCFPAVLNFARAAPESAALAKKQLRHFKFGWGGKIIAGRNDFFPKLKT